MIDDVVWLASATDSVAIVLDGTRHTPGAGLARVSDTQQNGTDVLGPFVEYTTAWLAGPTSVPVSTSVKVYSQTAVFQLLFPAGALNTSSGTSDKVSSAFPVLDLGRANQSHGYLTWGLHQSGWGGITTGTWGNSTSFPGGMASSAPVVVFNAVLTTSVVISAASNFMTHSSCFPAPGQLEFGLMDSVSAVPSGYSLKTILQVGTGVNAAMEDWGSTLQTMYSTDRSAVASDPTLTQLGYRCVRACFQHQYM